MPRYVSLFIHSQHGQATPTAQAGSNTGTQAACPPCRVSSASQVTAQVDATSPTEERVCVFTLLCYDYECMNEEFCKT